MRSTKCITLTLIALFVLSGCGTVLKGPKMSEVYALLPHVKKSKVRIHFIRPGKKAVLQPARIYIDKKEVIRLPLSGCHVEEISAGEHTIGVDMKGYIGDYENNFMFEPGQTRYFKVWWRESLAWTAPFGMIGAAINHAVSPSSNDGPLEIIDLPEKDALLLFEQCILYKEENQ